MAFFLVLGTAGFAQNSALECYNAARLKYEDGVYPMTIELLNRSLSYDSSFADAYFLLGKTCLDLGQNDSAIAELSQAINKAPAGEPSVSEYYLYRGIAYMGNKEYFLAGKDFEKAKDLNPSDPEIYFEDSKLKYISRKDKSEAITDLDKAIQLDPDYAPYYQKRAEYKYYLARFDFSSDKLLESAIRDMTFAISLDPGNYDYYRFRSDMYKQAGDPDLAVQDYTEMIHLKPEKFQAYTDRGIIRMQNDEYKDAISDFSNAIEINPDDNKNYRYRGLCRYNSSDYRGAYQDFSSAIMMLSKQKFPVADIPRMQRILADTYLKRGVSSVSMGDNYGACHDFRKAFDLGSHLGLNYYKKYCEY